MKNIIFSIKELYEIKDDDFIAILLEHTNSQNENSKLKIDSWLDCLGFLKEQFKNLSDEQKEILLCFEYKLFDGTWADVIIICENKLIVLEFKSGKSSDKETLGAHIAQLKGYFNKITKCNKNIWERFKNGFEVYKFLVYTNETMKSKLRHRPNFIKITDEFKDILPLLSAAPQSKEAAQALLEFDIRLDNTTIEAMKELLQNQCLNKMYTDEKSIDICSNIIEKSAPNTLNLVFIKGNPGTGKTGTGLVLIEKYLKSNPLYATGNGNLASIFKALLKTQKHEGVPDSIISEIHSL